MKKNRQSVNNHKKRKAGLQAKQSARETFEQRSRRLADARYEEQVRRNKIYHQAVSRGRTQERLYPHQIIKSFPEVFVFDSLAGLFGDLKSYGERIPTLVVLDESHSIKESNKIMSPNTIEHDPNEFEKQED